MTGAGLDAEITATPLVWRGIFDALEPHLPPRRPGRRPRAAADDRRPITKPGTGRIL